MGYEHTPGAVSGAPVSAYFWELLEHSRFGGPLREEFKVRPRAASHQPAAL